MAGQYLNREHATAVTQRTLAQRCPGKVFVPVSVILGRLWRLRRRHVQQFAAPGQLFSAVAIAEEAVITNALEPLRQSMKEESADELLGRKRHGFLLALVTVILVSKMDMAGFDVQQSIVRDSDAVSIAADVIQDLFGSSEGRLGIDDPFRLLYRGQVTSELVLIPEILQSGEELQLAGVESVLEML
jgi:hypothetical protein